MTYDSNPVPVKSVSVIEFSMSMVETLQKMSSTVRGVSEVGLYPRVSRIIVEFIELYKILIPDGVEVYLHPALTFVGTDKSTDYAVIVVSIVSYLYIFRL